MAEVEEHERRKGEEESVVVFVSDSANVVFVREVARRLVAGHCYCIYTYLLQSYNDQSCSPL